MAQKRYDKYGNVGTGAGYVYTVDPTAIQPPQYENPNVYSADTSQNKQGWYDAGLAAMANDPTSTWYTGGGQYEASYVYDQIQQNKDVWHSADDQMKKLQAEYANGTSSFTAEQYASEMQRLQDVKDMANKSAEAWRATAGYSGGADGSEYIALGGAGIGSMGTSRVQDSNSMYSGNTGGSAEGFYVNYYTPGQEGISADELAQANPNFVNLQGTAQGTNAGYDDLAREMYINYTKTQDGIGEMMGMSGLGGSGLTETSRVNLGNQYQEGLYQNEQARNQALNALRTQIASYLSQGAITQEQADALYAGLTTGDYTVQGEGIPAVAESWNSVFVPYNEGGSGQNQLADIGAMTEAYRAALAQQYANPQTATYDGGALTPTLDEASMYYLLKSIGMNDDAINAYYTPGVKAPTLADVIAERTPQVQQVQQQTVQNGGGGNRVADPNAILAQLAQQYGVGTNQYDEAGFAAAVNSAITSGQITAADYTAWGKTIGTVNDPTAMINYWGRTYDTATFNKLIDTAAASGQITWEEAAAAKKNKPAQISPTADALDPVANPLMDNVYNAPTTAAATNPTTGGQTGNSNVKKYLDTLMRGENTNTGLMETSVTLTPENLTTYSQLMQPTEFAQLVKAEIDSGNLPWNAYTAWASTQPWYSNWAFDPRGAAVNPSAGISSPTQYSTQPAENNKITNDLNRWYNTYDRDTFRKFVNTAVSNKQMSWKDVMAWAERTGAIL